MKNFISSIASVIKILYIYQEGKFDFVWKVFVQISGFKASLVQVILFSIFSLSLQLLPE